MSIRDPASICAAYLDPCTRVPAASHAVGGNGRRGPYIALRLARALGAMIDVAEGQAHAPQSQRAWGDLVGGLYEARRFADYAGRSCDQPHVSAGKRRVLFDMACRWTKAAAGKHPRAWAFLVATAE